MQFRDRAAWMLAGVGGDAFRRTERLSAGAAEEERVLQSTTALRARRRRVARHRLLKPGGFSRHWFRNPEPQLGLTQLAGEGAANEPAGAVFQLVDVDYAHQPQPPRSGRRRFSFHHHVRPALEPSPTDEGHPMTRDVPDRGLTRQPGPLPQRPG